MSDWEIFHKIYTATPVDETKPHGWIQWKGTDVCVDLHCECGALHHYDGDFLYHWKCPTCGRKWSLDPNIKLLPVNEEQATFIETTHIGFKS